MPDPADFFDYEEQDEWEEYERSSLEELADTCLGMFAIYLMLAALILLIGILSYHLIGALIG